MRDMQCNRVRRRGALMWERSSRGACGCVGSGEEALVRRCRRQRARKRRIETRQEVRQRRAG